MRGRRFHDKFDSPDLIRAYEAGYADGHDAGHAAAARTSTPWPVREVQECGCPTCGESCYANADGEGYALCALCFAAGCTRQLARHRDHRGRWRGRPRA